MKNLVTPKTIVLLTLLSALALSGCLSRQTCTECDEQARRFLSALSQGQTSRAFEALFQGSLLNDQSLKSQQFIRLTNGLLRQYGDILSYEPSGAKRVGRIASVSYLLYQERGASRWTFYFYRAPENDQWRLKDLNASDQSRFLTESP